MNYKALFVGLIVLLNFENIFPQNCSPKYFGEYVCEALAAKGDSDRLIFSISLQRPTYDSLNTPSNKANLRKWSDSIFAKYDLRDFEHPDQRLSTPLDTNLDWIYSFLLIRKVDANALVEESFVSRMSYYPAGPQTGLFRKTYRGGFGERENRNFYRVDGKTLEVRNQSKVFKLDKTQK